MEPNYSTKALAEATLKRFDEEMQKPEPAKADKAFVDQIISELELSDSSFERKLVEWESLPALLRDIVLSRYDESYLKKILQYAFGSKS